MMLETPLKFNSEFTPEIHGGWKAILSYWVSVTFQGLFSVKLQAGRTGKIAACILTDFPFEKNGL